MLGGAMHEVEMLVAKAVRGLAPAVTGGDGCRWGWLVTSRDHETSHVEVYTR